MVGPKYQADIPECVGPGPVSQPGGGDGKKASIVHLSTASAEAIFSQGRIEHQLLEVSIKGWAGREEENRGGGGGEREREKREEEEEIGVGGVREATTVLLNFNM
jgi:hypothetical protein